MTTIEEMIRRGAGAVGPISLRFAEDLLRQAKFNGPITVHYRDGIPQKLELGRPVVVALSPPAAQEPLDNG